MKKNNAKSAKWLNFRAPVALLLVSTLLIAPTLQDYFKKCATASDSNPVKVPSADGGEYVARSKGDCCQTVCMWWMQDHPEAFLSISACIYACEKF